MGRCADGVFVCLRVRVVSFLHRVFSFGKTLASLLLPLLLFGAARYAMSFAWQLHSFVLRVSSVPVLQCREATAQSQPQSQSSLCFSSVSVAVAVSVQFCQSARHTHTQTQSQPLR